MHIIQNYASLARTPARTHALEIVEAGLRAIDTEQAIRNAIRYDGTTLRIGPDTFSLSDYHHVYIIGFGKASCRAAQALESILKDRITSGIVIGIAPGSCEIITSYAGTHPMPSDENVSYSQEIITRMKDITPNDLVIVIVSGGGSALLCWPTTECTQGRRLYQDSLRTGMSIRELNTIRKHISELKGGGLAKALYPATVIGLIFSDVPGDNPDMVASGPIYPDASTVADAQAIIERYALDPYDLKETPKEQHWFDRVHNHVIVSNQQALNAMKIRSQELGYHAVVLAHDMQEEADRVIREMQATRQPHSVVLMGGEYRLIIKESGGKGGRNQHAALTALGMLREQEVFISLATDGLDNSDAAGALVDALVQADASRASLQPEHHLATHQEYSFFEPISALIMTGPTQANVSDIALLLTP